MSEAVTFSGNSDSLAVADDSHAKTAERLVKAVTTAEKPRSTAQIVKLLPKAVQPELHVAEELLKKEVAAGTIYQYPPYRDKTQFWNISPEEFARNQLLLKAAKGGQLKSKIVGEVCSLAACKQIAKSRIDAIFTTLVSEGHIQKLAPYIGGKTPLFSTSQADPAEYLNDALDKLSKKLNLTTQAILDAYITANTGTATANSGTETFAAPTVPSHDDRIIEAMKELEPRVTSGAMVSIRELRRKLELSYEGTAFDQALLEESRKQRVFLHRFDRENLIDESETRELLRDEHGVCYNTVSLRT